MTARRDPAVFLQDILDSILLIGRYTEGLTFDQFRESQVTQDAVIRRVTIIGEAVKRLPEPLRRRHPEPPWPAIAGARDVVIHGYDRVDLGAVWDIVQVDLPPLQRAVQEMLEEVGKSGPVA